MSLPPSRRHSRRSTSNLNFTSMSISPLSSREISSADFTRRSYLTGISAPTTPGILTRTPSSTHLADPPRSKSSSHLPPPHPRSKSSSHLPVADSSAWFQRTGAVLTSRSRSSKGQSWLTTRASSTSLSHADDEDSPPSTPHAGVISSPLWGEAEPEDYFSFPSRRREEEEEEEIYGGKFRLGQLFDRLIGWSVFGDDGDSSDEEEQLEERKGRRAEQRVAEPELEDDGDERRKRRDLDEGWQDPAWFFSIASNVLF